MIMCINFCESLLYSYLIFPLFSFTYCPTLAIKAKYTVYELNTCFRLLSSKSFRLSSAFPSLLCNATMTSLCFDARACAEDGKR